MLPASICHADTCCFSHSLPDSPPKMRPVETRFIASLGIRQTRTIRPSTEGLTNTVVNVTALKNNRFSVKKIERKLSQL